MVKSFKKFVAVATACALIMTPLSANAEGETSAEGSTTGSSQIEGIINKDIFSVVLPTIADGDTTFDFIIDPQGLIAATSNAAYANATFSDADKALFFKNDTDKYSSTSNSLTAVNKGTGVVDVTLSATADALKDDTAGYSIQLADSASFASSNTTTSLYLALASGSDTVALTEDGASISTSLEAAPADAYEVKYENGAYSYGLTDAAQAADYTGFDSLDFNLTGACNTNADWTAAKDATPTVEVIWALKKHYDDINITKLASSSAPITVTTGGEVTSATYVKLNGVANSITLAKGTHYTVNGNSLTISSTLAKAYTKNDTVIKLTYADGSSQLLTITAQTHADITVSKAAASTAAFTVTTDQVVQSAAYVKLNGTASSVALSENVQYTLNGTSFTITTALAKALTKGETVINLTYADGTSQLLIITVQ